MRENIGEASGRWLFRLQSVKKQFRVWKVNKGFNFQDLINTAYIIGDYEAIYEKQISKNFLQKNNFHITQEEKELHNMCIVVCV